MIPKARGMCCLPDSNEVWILICHSWPSAMFLYFNRSLKGLGNIVILSVAASARVAVGSRIFDVNVPSASHSPAAASPSYRLTIAKVFILNMHLHLRVWQSIFQGSYLDSFLLRPRRAGLASSNASVCVSYSACIRAYLPCAKVFPYYYQCVL